MRDPLAEVVALIQPTARVLKSVSGSGRWRVRRSTLAQPFYCLVLHGACRLHVGSGAAVVLRSGDFVLIPAADEFTMTSIDPPTSTRSVTVPAAAGRGEVRLGTGSGPPDVRLLLGHCSLSAPDGNLLAALLPTHVHLRGVRRLSTLVKLLSDEARAQRPAKEVILARLLEILFIEALRGAADVQSTPGLGRALADERVARAIRLMHQSPMNPWTVEKLARSAALSRSAFFERFSRVVGVAPMKYLLALRMLLARKLLQEEGLGIAEVAEKVGYSSGSTFRVAFTRHLGYAPSRYAKQQSDAGGNR